MTNILSLDKFKTPPESHRCAIVGVDHLIECYHDVYQYKWGYKVGSNESPKFLLLNGNDALASFAGKSQEFEDDEGVYINSIEVCHSKTSLLYILYKLNLDSKQFNFNVVDHYLNYMFEDCKLPVVVSLVEYQGNNKCEAALAVPINMQLFLTSLLSQYEPSDNVIKLRGGEPT